MQDDYSGFSDDHDPDPPEHPHRRKHNPDTSINKLSGKRWTACDQCNQGKKRASQLLPLSLDPFTYDQNQRQADDTVFTYGGRKVRPVRKEGIGVYEGEQET